MSKQHFSTFLVKDPNSGFLKVYLLK